MANENKPTEQNNGNTESYAESDQDHGNMNNGNIGGNMGVIGENSEEASNKDAKNSAGNISESDAGKAGSGLKDGQKS